MAKTKKKITGRVKQTFSLDGLQFKKIVFVSKDGLTPADHYRLAIRDYLKKLESENVFINFTQ